MTELIDELKVTASIIDYRCVNILRTLKLLEKDVAILHTSKSRRTQDKICEDIYIKLDYIEILLSKNIDDIMSVEIIELDKTSPKLSDTTLKKDDNGEHYYQ